MKDTSIHYCKAFVKTGKPIVVTDMETNKERTTDNWGRIFYDKHGVKWRVGVKYKNTTGKAKRRGAKAMLVVEKIG